MKNKRSPLPEHVIRAMRRDDGYIQMRYTEYGVRYEVHLLTANGYKPHLVVSDADMKQLYKDGIIKHVGDGKWKLTEQGEEEE